MKCMTCIASDQCILHELVRDTLKLYINQVFRISCVHDLSVSFDMCQVEIISVNDKKKAE